MRAATAKGGHLRNDAAEAVYPWGVWMSTEKILDTSQHNYTLTFAPGASCASE